MIFKVVLLFVQFFCLKLNDFQFYFLILISFYQFLQYHQHPFTVRHHLQSGHLLAICYCSERCQQGLFDIFSREPRLYKRVCPSVSPLVSPSVSNLFFWRAETRTANDLCCVSGLVLILLLPDKTRPITISRMLRANQPTDQPSGLQNHVHATKKCRGSFSVICSPITFIATKPQYDELIQHRDYAEKAWNNAFKLALIKLVYLVLKRLNSNQ